MKSFALCLLLTLFSLPVSGFDKSDNSSLEQQVYQEVNRLRTSRRLPPLVWNNAVAAEARRHALNMAQRNFFAHRDPNRGDVGQRFTASGIDWQRCSENIYEEMGIRNPVGAAVRAWMESPGHRRNMLDRSVGETGVGIAVRGDGKLYFVQEFLQRKKQRR